MQLQNSLQTINNAYFYPVRTNLIHMTLQIGRFKLFIISVILLFLLFFAPNLRMLVIGQKTDGTVFKLSAFTAGEHNSRVNFIAENKLEYRFEVNSNVKGTATVIYDPKNPADAYLFNFMNFVLEKIIFSLLAAIPSTIFVGTYVTTTPLLVTSVPCIELAVIKHNALLLPQVLNKLPPLGILAFP